MTGETIDHAVLLGCGCIRLPWSGERFADQIARWFDGDGPAPTPTCVLHGPTVTAVVTRCGTGVILCAAEGCQS